MSFYVGEPLFASQPVPTRLSRDNGFCLSASLAVSRLSKYLNIVGLYRCVRVTASPLQQVLMFNRTLLRRTVTNTHTRHTQLRFRYQPDLALAPPTISRPFGKVDEEGIPPNIPCCHPISSPGPSPCCPSIETRACHDNKEVKSHTAAYCKNHWTNIAVSYENRQQIPLATRFLRLALTAEFGPWALIRGWHLVGQLLRSL